MFKPIFKIKNKNNWHYIFNNPNAIDIIEMYIHSQYATYNTLVELSTNHGAINLLLNNEKLINWSCICSNKSPDLMKLINKHIDVFNRIPYDNSGYDMRTLSSNRYAMPFLKNHINRIDWVSFSFNDCEEAIEILKQHHEKINWINLSKNKCAISLLESNIDKVDWFNLSSNPNALDILDKYHNNISWLALISINANPNKYKLIKKYLHIDAHRDLIMRLIIHYNIMNEEDYFLIPIELLDIIQLANLNESDYWYAVSGINDKRILPMFEENIDKLNCQRITMNPCAIPLLEKYPHLIDWGMLGHKSNPESLRFIRVLDKKRMNQQCKKFARELMEYVFHPLRIERFASTYKIKMECYLEQL